MITIYAMERCEVDYCGRERSLPCGEAQANSPPSLAKPSQLRHHVCEWFEDALAGVPYALKRPQHFDRDLAFGLQVLREIDGCHTDTAQLVQPIESAVTCLRTHVSYFRLPGDTHPKAGMERTRLERELEDHHATAFGWAQHLCEYRTTAEDVSQ